MRKTSNKIPATIEKPTMAPEIRKIHNKTPTIRKTQAKTPVPQRLPQEPRPLQSLLSVQASWIMVNPVNGNMTQQTRLRRTMSPHLQAPKNDPN